MNDFLTWSLVVLQIMKSVIALLFCSSASASLMDEFVKHVDPVSSSEPHRFVNTVHMQTGLGRVRREAGKSLLIIYDCHF